MLRGRLGTPARTTVHRSIELSKSKTTSSFVSQIIHLEDRRAATIALAATDVDLGFGALEHVELFGDVSKQEADDLGKH